MFSKWAYQKRTKLQFCRGNEEKWEKFFFDNCKRIWEIIYTSNFKCNLKSSLRHFQYQIIIRTLPTNKFLFGCGLSTTDKCSFFEVNTETIEHLLWYCPHVKKFLFMLLEELGLPPKITLELNCHNMFAIVKLKIKNYAIFYSIQAKNTHTHKKLHIQNNMHRKYTVYQRVQKLKNSGTVTALRLQQWKMIQAAFQIMRKNGTRSAII